MKYLHRLAKRLVLIDSLVTPLHKWSCFDCEWTDRAIQSASGRKRFFSSAELAEIRAQYCIEARKAHDNRRKYWLYSYSLDRVLGTAKSLEALVKFELKEFGRANGLRCVAFLDNCPDDETREAYILEYNRQTVGKGA